MIRVLQVVDSMNMGGIQTFLMNIYRNIDKNKVQFDFLIKSRKDEFEKEIKELGGNIYRIPPRNKGIITYKKKLEEFMRLHSSEYNTIHMHVSSLTDIMPIVIAKKYNIKNRFIHSHNTHQKGIIHNIFNLINQKRIMKYATKLFACSTEAGKYCFKDKSFEVVRNGINAKLYKYDLEIRDKKRKELKIQNDEIAFVNVGRFSKQKNHLFLLEIFKEYIKINSHALLFFVGDGELKEIIKNRIKELDLENNIRMLGIRRDINEILQAMDAFLLPSLHEGLPVVGIEAQASGLKLYTSDNVSPELKITDLVKFYSLNNTAEKWAKNIFEDMQTYKREDTYNDIVKAGYDIERTTKILEKYYQS